MTITILKKEEKFDQPLLNKIQAEIEGSATHLIQDDVEVEQTNYPIDNELNDYKDVIKSASEAAISNYLKTQRSQPLKTQSDVKTLTTAVETATQISVPHKSKALVISAPSPFQINPSEIDAITQKMADLLATTSFTQNYIDNSSQNIETQAFQQISEISNLLISAETNGTKIKKKEIIQELQLNLKNLSNYYLDNQCLAEYHSYKSLSDKLKKIDEAGLKSIISQLNDLGRLNESMKLLQNQLINLLNYTETTPLNSFETYQKLQQVIQDSKNLISNIDQVRNAYLKDFNTNIDKKITQEALQTTQSLYMSHLNQVAKGLNQVIDRLETFMQIKNPSPISSLENKKFVIFTCSFGTGHKVTAGAIKDLLNGKKANANVYDLSTGALLGKDRLRYIFKSLGIDYNEHPLNSVDVFNEILKRQLYSVINAKHKIDLALRDLFHLPGKDGVAGYAGPLNNSWEKTQIRELLLAERPDHIITTYHMDLNPILEVAEELGIPILHIPTDYDMKSWEVFNDTPPTYPHFKTLVPNQDILDTLESRAPLTLEQIVTGVGIPLRAEFYQTLTAEEAKAYRQQRGIQENEKVLYLSAGGNGQNLPHPELLANSTTWTTPLRIEVIAGRNRGFVEQLQKNLKPKDGNPFLLQGSNPYVTIEIVTNPDLSRKGTEEEFFIKADELSKILDIADASVAKAGGLSVAELLFKGVPILFDQRKTPFIWELFNIKMAVKENMGISSFKLKSLEKDLNSLLQIPKTKKPQFHFENGHEIFAQTVLNQITGAKTDINLINRRGELLASLDFNAKELNSLKYKNLAKSIKLRLKNKVNFQLTIEDGNLHIKDLKNIKLTSKEQEINKANNINTLTDYIKAEYAKVNISKREIDDPNLKKLIKYISLLKKYG